MRSVVLCLSETSHKHWMSKMDLKYKMSLHAVDSVHHMSQWLCFCLPTRCVRVPLHQEWCTGLCLLLTCIPILSLCLSKCFCVNCKINIDCYTPLWFDDCTAVRSDSPLLRCFSSVERGPEASRTPHCWHWYHPQCCLLLTQGQMHRFPPFSLSPLCVAT